jgi:hypothetical protein
LTINLTLHLSSNKTVSIQDAVLQTLAYSDVFDYPLHLDELHRYLPVSISMVDLKLALESRDNCIGSKSGYYFLAGREALVELRRQRNAASQRAFARATLYGRILGGLPFIRMVGLTGSLAVLNCDETADLDYMLVAAHGRVWTARAFALLFGRATARFGYTLCPNLVISDQALEWPKRDLYSARELCQMIPISGLKVYYQLRQANQWINALLPNAGSESESTVAISNGPIWQAVAEIPLHSSSFDVLEKWEMKRKAARFASQIGYGVETVFNENMCQGNFSHHRTQTLDAYRHRLRILGLDRNIQLDEWQVHGPS